MLNIMTTNTLLLSYLLLFVGFVLLAWAANTLISGAASLAKKFGLSPRLIGLTIIALGTSVPEMVISTIAALHGNPNMAVGNAIGSNITNMTLVLGITTLIIPLRVRSTTLKKEFPLLFLAMLLVGFFMLNGQLSRINGIFLIIGAILTILWLIQEGRKKKKSIIKKDILDAEYKKEINVKIPTSKAVLQLTLGLILLPISSNIIVENAVIIAHHFNVSDLIIGLTILALGTSLPELATSLACAKKREYDIIIGNIIGSNIFNLLAVIGLPAIIHPIILNHQLLRRDFSVMFGVTVLLYFFAFGRQDKGRITRFKGGILLSIYVAYLLVLFFVR
jgi:cation:H+ antiporter